MNVDKIHDGLVTTCVDGTCPWPSRVRATQGGGEFPLTPCAYPCKVQ